MSARGPGTLSLRPDATVAHEGKLSPEKWGPPPGTLWVNPESPPSPPLFACDLPGHALLCWPPGFPAQDAFPW